MGTTATTPSSEPAGLSTTSRIANVFFSPITTFADLKRDPSWWVAWLLISVASVLFAFSMQQKIGWEQLTQNEISASRMQTEQWDKLTSEQRQQQLPIRAKFTAGVWYGMPVFILIFSVIFAALYLATFNFGLGAEISFKASLAVVIYAAIPLALKWLLAVVALYAGASAAGFDPQNPVATNLSFLPGIGRLEHPVWYALTSSVDLFRIWSVILTGIGFACVAKVKRSTAFSVAVAWYIIGMSIGVVLVAIFS